MEAKDLVRIAKALGDGTRFAILREIAAAGEISCGDLAARFPIAQATVSHHLRILGESGLVAARREGQHSYFSLAPGAMDAYRAALGSLAPATGRRGRTQRGAASRVPGNIDS